LTKFAHPIRLTNHNTIIMADLSNFGGPDEENAEVKRLNAEVVCLKTILFPGSRSLCRLCLKRRR
jgi:hypothetical protein